MSYEEHSAPSGVSAWDSVRTVHRASSRRRGGFLSPGSIGLPLWFNYPRDQHQTLQQGEIKMLDILLIIFYSHQLFVSHLQL